MITIINWKIFLLFEVLVEVYGIIISVIEADGFVVVSFEVESVVVDFNVVGWVFGFVLSLVELSMDFFSFLVIFFVVDSECHFIIIIEAWEPIIMSFKFNNPIESLSNSISWIITTFLRLTWTKFNSPGFTIDGNSVISTASKNEVFLGHNNNNSRETELKFSIQSTITMLIDQDGTSGQFSVGLGVIQAQFWDFFLF